MIQLGITGHRKLSNPELIEEGISSVFSKISSMYPKEDFIVVSALAEGADCLFAKIAISKFRAKLIVRLPLPVWDYRNDFSNDDALRIFDMLLARANDVSLEELSGNREDAYFAAGKYVLDHCHILIAIWDGQQARGRGGTAEIVQLARQCGRPLAWIQAEDRYIEADYSPDFIKNQHEKVIFERFPSKS